LTLSCFIHTENKKNTSGGAVSLHRARKKGRSEKPQPLNVIAQVQ
jgi:hypothetical protein